MGEKEIGKDHEKGMAERRHKGQGSTEKASQKKKKGQRKKGQVNEERA